MTDKLEYWTFYDRDALCSRHRTLAAALRAVAKCESAGGFRHRIYEVREIKRPRHAGKGGSNG